MFDFHKIWRIKTQNDLRNFFSSKIDKNTFFNQLE